MPPLTFAEIEGLVTEGRLLVPGLREVFWNTVKGYDSKIPTVCSVATSDKYREQLFSFAGLTDFNVWPDGQPIAYEDVEGRYLSTLEHVDYSKGIKFTRKLMRESRYNLISTAVRQLAIAAMSKREALAAAFFAGGFDTVWNSSEGQYFFDDDHPLSGRSSTSTDSNLTTGALSRSNLETGIIMMRETLDDLGRKMGIVPIRLIVPPALEFEMKRILGSPDDPSTANRAINPVQRLGIQGVIWPELTSDTAWFLQGDNTRTLWFDRKPLSEALSEVDFDTEDQKYKAAFVASVGAADWRGWVGSLGT